MKCKICGKTAKQVNKSHCWMKAQQCNKCHYLGKPLGWGKGTWTVV